MQMGKNNFEFHLQIQWERRLPFEESPFLASLTQAPLWVFGSVKLVWWKCKWNQLLIEDTNDVLFSDAALESWFLWFFGTLIVEKQTYHKFSPLQTKEMGDVLMIRGGYYTGAYRMLKIIWRLNEMYPPLCSTNYLTSRLVPRFLFITILYYLHGRSTCPAFICTPSKSNVCLSRFLSLYRFYYVFILQR